MVEKIKMIKDLVLQCMEQKISERGMDRIDVKEFGELADVVKDLAEAEKSCWEAQYYRDVSEAMEGSQGYSAGGASGSMGYRGQSMRRGYPSMGYHDDIQHLREAIGSATPEEREKINRELLQMVTM